MIKLAIVSPCYNEEEVLEQSAARLTALFDELVGKEKISADSFVLFVNDGSKDRTWNIIKKLHKENLYVKGMNLARNVGHQSAIMAGMMTAKDWSDAVVTIDADLQDDINAIPQMVDYYNKGIDTIYGVRKERKTDTFFKKHTAQLFYKLMKTMGGDIIYNHADFRLMSKRALRALISYPERNLFLRGIVPMMGYPSAAVYYDRKERFAGESKYPFTKMLNFALDGITSFSVKPLRLITAAGLVFMLSSIIAIIYALSAFASGHVFPGWTSLLISVWFIGGAILTAIGIIGEYVGKIYKEVKRRPRYFIEKEVNL